THTLTHTRPRKPGASGTWQGPFARQAHDRRPDSPLSPATEAGTRRAMASAVPVLWQVRQSHYNEEARRALDLERIRHEPPAPARKPHPQGTAVAPAGPPRAARDVDDTPKVRARPRARRAGDRRLDAHHRRRRGAAARAAALPRGAGGASTCARARGVLRRGA